jgi:D-beta-D-heptose 7-phosphate kinase/D-beta-D-heptose 1-phosphate adenosyltransferase
MTLVEVGCQPRHIPVFGTDQVADVTGAGDTVLAVLSVALAAGADPSDAARLANIAAGLVVMKLGTATVSAAEMRAAIATEGGPSDGA